MSPKNTAQLLPLRPSEPYMPNCCLSTPFFLHHHQILQVFARTRNLLQQHYTAEAYRLSKTAFFPLYCLFRI
jgi:hypothetical protein